LCVRINIDNVAHSVRWFGGEAARQKAKGEHARTMRRAFRQKSGRTNVRINLLP
jgi:hypothetical protein